MKTDRTSGENLHDSYLQCHHHWALCHVSRMQWNKGRGISQIWTYVKWLGFNQPKAYFSISIFKNHAKQGNIQSHTLVFPIEFPPPALTMVNVDHRSLICQGSETSSKSSFQTFKSAHTGLYTLWLTSPFCSLWLCLHLNANKEEK